MPVPAGIDPVWRELVCQLTQDSQDVGRVVYHREGRYRGQLSIAGRLVGRIDDPSLGRLIAELAEHRLQVLRALYAVDKATAEPAKEAA